MQSPSVTIYILTYNRPDYLEQCLKSVRNQTFQNFRTIILDNCSADELDSLLHKFSDLNIEYIRHEKNLGSTGNLLFAWNHPKDSKYFILFHDDDIMHPLFIEKEFKIMEQSDDIVWVASNSTSFIGIPPNFKEISLNTFTQSTGSELAIHLIKGLGLTFSSVMYRSNLVSEINLSNLIEKYSIIFDRPLLFSLISEKKCAFIDQSLILYRCHDLQDSKTGPINEDNLFALFLSYKKLLTDSWSDIEKSIFYNWSAFQIVDGYKRISRDKKSSFFKYLSKARSLGIYNDVLLYKFCVGFLKSNISRLLRKFT